MATAATRTERNQFQAAQLLAQGWTITAVAQQLGLRRQTISGWMKLSANFQAELRRAKKSDRAELKRKLNGLGVQALTELTPQQRKRNAWRLIDAAANRQDDLQMIAKEAAEQVLQHQRSAMTR